MSVTTLLVLAERGKNLVDMETLEDWFQAYVDSFARLRLFNVATEVIKHAAYVPRLHAMNRNSTTIHLICEVCSKKMPVDHVSACCIPQGRKPVP